MLFYRICLGCRYFEKQKLQGAWSFDFGGISWVLLGTFGSEIYRYLSL